MNEMKCPFCGKFLGVLDGEAQIKCPRCKRLSTYRSKPEQNPSSDPAPDLCNKDDESSKVH